MKVALIKDVSGLGKKNDVKTVSDGYALNFLIPQKSAEIATSAVLARVELTKKQEVAEKKIKEDLLSMNLHSIHDKVVEIEREANDKGGLFASIHKEEIAKLAHEELEVDILPEFITLDKPIKELGEHKIDIKVNGKSATFTLNVKGK